MDMTCSVCGQTNDDALGVCRFCGGAYVPLSKKDKKALETEEPEAETTSKSKGK